MTLATDTNVSVDWTIERDGLLRMTESMNWRTDTGDANYTCLLAGFEYGRGDMGIPTSETFRRADFPNNPLTREFDYDTLHRLTDVDYPNEPNEEFVYLMKDLYSVAGMTNWWGGLVESYDYDAYGRPIMKRHAQLPWACDLNNDGDIDQDDQDIFDTHYAGDGNEPNGLAGWRSDFDSDGDVGLADGIILAFLMNSPHTQGLYTGPMAKSRSANPYFFTGRWLDPLDLDDNDTPTDFTDDFLRLPIYYFRARTYDPVYMRFVQTDRLGVAIQQPLLQTKGGRSLRIRADSANPAVSRRDGPL